jgi:hypothetical protein
MEKITETRVSEIHAEICLEASRAELYNIDRQITEQARASAARTTLGKLFRRGQDLNRMGRLQAGYRIANAVAREAARAEAALQEVSGLELTQYKGYSLSDGNEYSMSQIEGILDGKLTRLYELTLAPGVTDVDAFSHRHPSQAQRVAYVDSVELMGQKAEAIGKRVTGTLVERNKFDRIDRKPFPNGIASATDFFIRTIISGASA